MNQDELLQFATEADKDGMPATAVELFRQLLSKGVDRESIWFRVAENLRELGRLKECEAILKTIDRVPPKKLWLLVLSWGQLYFDRGNFIEAESKFREAAQLNSKSTVPWVLLASSLARQERIQEAFDELIKGLNATGDLDEVYLNLGLFKRAMGDYVSARGFLERALAITPEYRQAQAALKDVELCLKYTATTASR